MQQYDDGNWISVSENYVFHTNRAKRTGKYT